MLRGCKAVAECRVTACLLRLACYTSAFQARASAPVPARASVALSLALCFCTKLLQ